jgi:molybdopterin-guanine dinucleotide biosynthesis protein A
VKPALIVLAAGASERLGECKALASITPRTPLELLLENGAVFDDVPPLVVTGADHARIQRAVPAGVAIAFNARWSAGRTGGVQLAALLRTGCDLCLAPVDGSGTKTERRLAAGWRRVSTGASVIRSSSGARSWKNLPTSPPKSP